MKIVSITYDPQVDAGTIYLKPRRSGMSVRTKVLDPPWQGGKGSILVDYDADGEVCAIEILDASEHLARLVGI